MPPSHAGIDRPAVVRAASLVHALVARPEVEAGWSEESSCAGMTVGGLARHLVGQSELVVTLLTADPAAHADAPLCTLLDNYAGAPWVGEDAEGAALDEALRVRSNAQGDEGHEVAVAHQAAALDRLPSLLADPPATVFVPWLRSRMATDDFLVTRLMEIVVHSDDLADSVGVAAPVFDDGVLEPVLGLLTALAVVRHGQGAVVRALTRPQRAPGSIAAF